VRRSLGKREYEISAFVKRTDEMNSLCQQAKNFPIKPVLLHKESSAGSPIDSAIPILF